MSTVERIALFIDGANLYASAKALGFDIDYKRSAEGISGQGTLDSGLLLHRAGGRSGIFVHPPSRRLARLQRLRRGDQADQGVRGLRPVAGRSKATWTSSSPSTRWRWPTTSTSWCCSPATATSGRSSRRFSARACGSRSCRRSRRSPRWSPTNCVVKRTSSSIWRSSCRGSGAIPAERPDARR